MITFLKSSKPLISHHNLTSCKLATSLEKQLKNSFDSCLRFYGRWIFIECSLNSNFFVCLIKLITWLNKIASVDQIFFTTFQGKMSKFKICRRFEQFSYFSIFPSPTFEKWKSLKYLRIWAFSTFSPSLFPNLEFWVLRSEAWDKVVIYNFFLGDLQVWCLKPGAQVN